VGETTLLVLSHLIDNTRNGQSIGISQATNFYKPIVSNKRR
jgi:hypothetical protein